MATITVVRSLDRDQLFWNVDPALRTIISQDAAFVRHYEEWLSMGLSSLWLAHRKTVIDYHDFNPVSAIQARIDFGFEEANPPSPHIAKIISQNIPTNYFLLQTYQVMKETTSFLVYFKNPEDAMLFSIANER